MILARIPAAARRATSPCLAALVLAGTALAGGTVYTTVQAGSWTDPAVWDLGSLPNATSQAHVDHGVVVDDVAEAASVRIAPQEFGGPEGEEPFFGLRVMDGGVLEAGTLVVGGAPFGGSVDQLGGLVLASAVRIGTVEWEASYSMEAGTLACEFLDVGPSFGQPEPNVYYQCAIRGPAPSITVTSTMALRDQSSLQVFPTAAGLLGLTPIAVHDLVVDGSAKVNVYPTYQAEPGDRWDLFTYSGGITGTIDLGFSGEYSMLLDTSVPGVVSVEVLDSPHPIPGETCSTAAVLDPAGGTVSAHLAYTEADPDEVPCYIDGSLFPRSDRWFSMTNATALPRAYRVRPVALAGFQPGWTGLEQFTACGTEPLACAGLGDTQGVAMPYPPLDVTVPPGESHLVRFASNASGSALEYDLEVTRIGAFEELGPGLAGTGGVPDLDVTGLLLEGEPTTFTVSNAASDALAAVFIGFGTGTPAPFKGGTLYPVPVALSVYLATSPVGELSFSFPWPAGSPPDFVFGVQAAVADAGAPAGVALTRAVRGVAP